MQLVVYLTSGSCGRSASSRMRNRSDSPSSSGVWDPIPRPSWTLGGRCEIGGSSDSVSIQGGFYRLIASLSSYPVLYLQFLSFHPYSKDLSLTSLRSHRISLCSSVSELIYCNADPDLAATYASQLKNKAKFEFCLRNVRNLQGRC